MKKYFLLFLILSTLTPLSLSSIASPASDSLGTCMIDSMTGKERKQLAQWIFFAMAAHPDIKEYSKVSAESQAKTNEIIGKLISRLLTETCVEQLKAAVKEDGQTAISGAFELVGKYAMQDFMASKEVLGSISGYVNFVDQEKLVNILKTK